MAPKRILVLTDHMPWGHRSIAKAIYGFLKTQEKENNFKIKKLRKLLLSILKNNFIKNNYFVHRDFHVSNMMEYKEGAKNKIERSIASLRLKRFPRIKEDYAKLIGRKNEKAK